MRKYLSHMPLKPSLAVKKNYSQIDKEALSIIYGVTKFRQYLYERRLTLVTDHKPLIHMSSPDKNITTIAAQRLQKWAIAIRGYQFNIQYKPTDQYGNADGLSRLPIGQDPQFDKNDIDDLVELTHVIYKALEECPLHFKDIHRQSKRDSILNQVTEYIRVGWPAAENITNDEKPF